MVQISCKDSQDDGLHLYGFFVLLIPTCISAYGWGEAPNSDVWGRFGYIVT